MKASPKPSLTGDLPRGVETNFWGRLQERGVDLDDVIEGGKNEDFLDRIALAMIMPRMFTPVAEHAEILLALNEAVWKDIAITAECIKAVGDPPQCPASNENALYCVTLVYDTGDALATFARNWAACAHVYGTAPTWRWDYPHSNSKSVQVRKGALSRPKGFRWTLAELGRCFQNQSVQEVCSILDKEQQKMGMGQELPLIGAIHRRWVLCINGKEIPLVDAPDLEIKSGTSGAFQCSPVMGYDHHRQKVFLAAGRVDGAPWAYGCGSLQ